LASAALLAVPGPAAASSTVVSIGGPNAFVPSAVTIGYSNSVMWDNNSTKDHTSTADKFGLWDVNVDADDLSDLVHFPRAGSFAYHCKIHSSMHGTVKVSMASTDNNPMVNETVTIVFAQAGYPAPHGFVEQIQKRKAGGTWKTWLNATSEVSKQFTPPKAKTFEFRARYKRISDGAATGWSPVLQIVVSP
jgi:plastocyanin